MMNNFSAIGRACFDPSIKQMPNGKSVCNFTIAVNRQFKNTQGEYEADFFPVQLYEKQAEFANNYIKKGDRVAITGRVQIRKYTDKEGLPKSITEVIGSSVESLESKSNRDEKPDREYKAAPAKGEKLPKQRDDAPQGTQGQQKASGRGDELPQLSDVVDPFD